MPSNRSGRRSEAGFTLLEVLVVLVIVGLALGVVATRGPRTNVALDLKGAAGTVSDTLRLARSRSVAGNRPVGVVFDVAAHALRLDGGTPQFLSPAISLAVTSTVENVAPGGNGGGLAAIRFAPDGSSSGGRVVLAERGRQMQVGVDWLTGRVSVGP